MVKLNKQTTLTGVSVLTIDGEEKQIAYMNATIPVSGAPNIGKSIQDVELFNSNKAEILKDFAAFDEYAYNLIGADETETAK